MKNYQKIKVNAPAKSVFDHRHIHETTVDSGKLIPVLCKEVLPGSKIKLGLETFARLQPMLAPVMHRMDVHLHAFFVPYRIIWDNFEKFVVQDPLNPTYSVPKITGTFAEWKAFQQSVTNTEVLKIRELMDYMGLPVKEIHDVPNPDDVADMLPISQLPFRAYLRIYDDYYRDQDLHAAVNHITADTDLSLTNVLHKPYLDDMLFLKRRCWEKDYFTIARPYQQKGSPVEIPIVGNAPVTGNYGVIQPGTGDTVLHEAITPGNDFLVNESNPSVALGSEGLTANLSDAASVSISDLRQSFAIQRFLEKLMRGGSRFKEYLKNFFGVISSDSRLDRAEYLFGTKTPISISEVLQTTGDAGTGLGDMAGHGISAGKSRYNVYNVEEHGYYIVIASIMPRTKYFQGIEKMWTRLDTLDFPLPEFAHLSEQPVLNHQLFVDKDVASDDTDGGLDIFGYQPIYEEYRTTPDRISGDLRDELNFWTMSRRFDSMPQLTDEFVECRPDELVFPVPNHGNFILQIFFDLFIIAPLPKYSVPV